jgi:hypothetical protein
MGLIYFKITLKHLQVCFQNFHIIFYYWHQKRTEIPLFCGKNICLGLQIIGYKDERPLWEAVVVVIGQ